MTPLQNAYHAAPHPPPPFLHQLTSLGKLCLACLWKRRGEGGWGLGIINHEKSVYIVTLEYRCILYLSGVTLGSIPPF